MKRNFNGKKRMLLAVAGAMLISPGSLVMADDAASDRQQIQSDYQQQSTPSEEKDLESQELDVKGSEINEPAGAERKTSDPYLGTKSSRLSTSDVSSTSAQQASFGTLSRTSEIIGMEVRNEQDQMLGEIKDVMIDAKSGHIPFVILSSESNDKLIALPPAALHAGEEKTLVLNMDKNRLNSAPSFNRAQWPNMSDQKFRTEVYQFYDVKPYWQGSSLESGSFESYASTSVTHEPAAWSTTTYESYGVSSSQEDSNARADRILRMYQGGKQHAAVMDRKIQAEGNPQVVIQEPKTYKGRYIHNAEVHMNEPSQKEEITEPSAAERTTVTRETTTISPTSPSVTATVPMGVTTYYRATELMRMNVKDTQGQSVGEIKDFAIDMESGRIAYTVVSAGGFLGVGEKWVVVPATMLNSSDSKTLVLNVDKNTLKGAPTFDRTNWESVSNQEFVTKVYSHYGQQPYWRSAEGIREPAGAGRENELQDQIKEQQFENKEQIEEQKEQLKDEVESPDQSELNGSSDLNEPAGAIQPSSSDDAESQSLQGGQSLDEPAGAGKSSGELSEPDQELKPQSDLEESQVAPERSSSEIKESSGAEKSQSSYESQSSDAKQSSSESATSAGFQSSTSSSEVEEAAGAAREQVSLDRIRSAIQSDSAVTDSSVQVSTENGKIVLRGTVNSETEKQQIEQKIREVIVDNQLRVQAGSAQEDESSQEIDSSPEEQE